MKAAESNQLLRQDSQKKAPAIPSSIKLKAFSGYRKNIFEGWKKLEDSTIAGEGYKVEFYRLSERTIDRMCDALNGWYNVWTKFRCDYEDTKGSKQGHLLSNDTLLVDGSAPSPGACRLVLS